MTDQTTDAMMTETVERIGTKRPTTEFYVYFAIIFAATLPLATLTWALAALKSRSEFRRPGRGGGYPTGKAPEGNPAAGIAASV